MKAFLYARVSTGYQDDGMQLREMQELARRRGFEIEEFRDVGCGSKAKRPGLDAMMALVRRGKCDAVIVYRFDRFARSLHQLVEALEEFRTRNVQFISVHEAIDTSTPMGKFAFSIFAAIAEFERELIRERTRSGVALARARGKTLGRPRRDVNVLKIQRLRASGNTWSEVSRKLGVPESTLRRRLNGVQNDPLIAFVSSKKADRPDR